MICITRRAQRQLPIVCKMQRNQSKLIDKWMYKHGRRHLHRKPFMGQPGILSVLWNLIPKQTG